MTALVLVDSKAGEFKASLDTFPGFLDAFEAAIDEGEVVGESFQDVLDNGGGIGAVRGSLGQRRPLLSL